MLDETHSALLNDHPMVKKAYDFYQDWGENPFFRYVGMHQFNGGYMFYDTDYFIMGRPVWVNIADPQLTRADVTNPEKQYLRGNQNTWFIWLYAGDVQKAFTNFPYWLPWFAYERRDNFHISDLDKTMLKLKKGSRHGKRTKTTTPA